MRNYLNINGAGVGAGASPDLSVYGALIEVGVGLVVGGATKKSIEKKNAEFIEKIKRLNAEQEQRLQKLLLENSTQMSKARALIDFLNKEEIAELGTQTKKDRILPLIGLGVAVVLLAIVFYKLKKQNG
jgi:hypothetical protein